MASVSSRYGFHSLGLTLLVFALIRRWLLRVADVWPASAVNLMIASASTVFSTILVCDSTISV